MSLALSAIATVLKMIFSVAGFVGGLDTVAVGAGGTGYAVNNVLTLAGGTGGTVTVTSVAAGVVTGVSLTTAGSGYQVANGVATTGGGGTGCTINVLTVALPISEVHQVSGPAQKVNLVDVSNMDSPSGYAEFIAGIGEGGEVTVEGNFLNDTNQAQVRTDHQNKTLRSYKIAVPLSPVVNWSFSGYVSSLDPNSKYDSKLGFSATVKITGKPTLA